MASHRTGIWETNWFSLIKCSYLSLLLVTTTTFIRFHVPKENVQPEEPSAICISVFREKSICCAKKAGSIKYVTSDIAHGQTYNRDVKESANWLT